MHIEPGVVTGAKILLSYATAAGAGLFGLKLAWGAVAARGLAPLAARTAAAAALTFSFFEILPHFPVGVSEVHLILGSTLFLIFGAAPAALGLALGLLIQGALFAPLDLPQYGMNLTTLLVPLFALRELAARVIAPETAYVDLNYRQALTLSLAYQGGVVSWVAFWALYGQGVAASNIAAIASFGAAYMLVVAIEPLVNLLALGAAKAARGSGVLDERLFKAI